MTIEFTHPPPQTAEIGTRGSPLEALAKRTKNAGAVAKP